MQANVGTIHLKKGTSGVLLLGILSALMAMTSLSVDIYLPAMPKMQQALQGDVELTITGFLIDFSIAQIFWGPVSDKYGNGFFSYSNSTSSISITFVTAQAAYLPQKIKSS